MKRITILLCLLFVINNVCTVCAPEVKHIKTCSYEGYIFPCNHPVHGFPRLNGCNLITNQIQKAEEILSAHFVEIKDRCRPNDAQISKSMLKIYIRQYWGSVNENGHVIVNICLVKKSVAKNENLEDDILYFLDGGCEIIDVIVDINEGTYSIIPHGYA